MNRKQYFVYKKSPSTNFMFSILLCCVVSVYTVAGAVEAVTDTGEATTTESVESAETSASTETDTDTETDNLISSSSDTSEAGLDTEGEPVVASENEGEEAIPLVDEDAASSSEVFLPSATSSSSPAVFQIQTPATSSDSESGDGTELLTTSTSTGATSSAAMSTTMSEPTASTSTSGVTIESGTAVAMANVLNIVNTNFVNSDGVVFFSNFLDAIVEALDLRALYASIADASCSLISCDDASTTVQVSNAVLLQNLISLQAQSGQNTIEGGSSGTINTGDAYAGLNLVNIANMNFVDSNYLLVTMNAFSDVNNDIIFPSADALLANLAASPSDASIALQNTGSVSNDVVVDASSGSNTLETEQGGSISTGSSGATSNVFNQLNASLVGGQQIMILLRVHGDWVGEVFGAPDDLLWYENPDGGVMLLDGGSGAGTTGGGSLAVNGTNDASIENDVQVVALTGENRITGTETGLISTGNAYAGANIVNMANGNVIGRNWVLAIINIFGDFKGNIAFGRPDLWVGEVIEAPKKIRNGSTLNVALTVMNNGDSPATNVVLEDDFEEDHLQITDSSVPYERTSNGKRRFNLGKIPPGGAVEVTYEASVFGTKPGQELVSTSQVVSRETDNNLTDNTETASVRTYRSSGGSGFRVRRLPGEAITAETASLATTTTAGARLEVKRVFKTFSLTTDFPSMRQVVMLRNPTNQTISGVTFKDIMTTSDGVVTNEEVWDLGDILPHESIELGYTLTFAPAASPGTYQLHSQVRTAVGGEDTHTNGTVVLQEGTVPLAAAIPPQTMGQVAGLVAQTVDAQTLDRATPKWFGSGFFNLQNIGDVLTTLPGRHFVSTSPNQYGAFTAWWSDWFGRLSAYLSSLFAPAVAEAQSRF